MTHIKILQVGEIHHYIPLSKKSFITSLPSDTLEYPEATYGVDVEMFTGNSTLTEDLVVWQYLAEVAPDCKITNVIVHNHFNIPVFRFEGPQSQCEAIANYWNENVASPGTVYEPTPIG